MQRREIRVSATSETKDVVVPLTQSRKLFWRAFWAAIVPMYFIVHYGQNHWGFDSIGTWYTVYCAVAFALLVAAVVALVGLMGQRRRRD